MDSTGKNEFNIWIKSVFPCNQFETKCKVKFIEAIRDGFNIKPLLVTYTCIDNTEQMAKTYQSHDIWYKTKRCSEI